MSIDPMIAGTEAGLVAIVVASIAFGLVYLYHRRQVKLDSIERQRAEQRVARREQEWT